MDKKKRKRTKTKNDLLRNIAHMRAWRVRMKRKSLELLGIGLPRFIWVSDEKEVSFVRRKGWTRYRLYPDNLT